MRQNFRMHVFVQLFTLIFEQITIYFCTPTFKLLLWRFFLCFERYSLHPLLGADEVNGQWWQLVTAIQDGDSFILCEWPSQGYSCTRSYHACSGLDATNKTFLEIPYMFLWSFSLQPFTPSQGFQSCPKVCNEQFAYEVFCSDILAAECDWGEITWRYWQLFAGNGVWINWWTSGDRVLSRLWLPLM
jgi:hypothetical protein